MTKFKYCGIPVEVIDEKQAKKLEKILAQPTCTTRGLEQAAPGLMAALQQELKTCSDVGLKPESFQVKGGVVLADVKLDRRRLKHGINIGNR